MKLFVWENYWSDHTPGLAVVVAENLEHAKTLLRMRENAEQCYYGEQNWGEVKEYDIEVGLVFNRHSEWIEFD